MTRLTTIAAVAVTLVLSGVVLADTPAGEPVKFSIESQPLEDALNQFAKQTGYQVLFQSDMVTKQTAPRVDGELTAEDALKALLGKSGLKFKFVNERTVSITEGKETVTTQGRAVPMRLAQAGASGEPDASEGEQPAAPKDEGEKEDEIQLEEVVVTGTHIRGQSIAPGNLIVLGRDQIESSGYGNLGQLVASLPQNFAGGASPTLTPNLNRGFSAYNTSAGTGINLRGLGTGATLTLLNGNRLSPAGQGTFVDISLIPLSAIDRVEILTDGASAIYGSDAVGGVVNIITRRNYEGTQSTARLGSVTSGGRQEYTVGQLFGHSWDRGNFTLNFEHGREDALTVDDRPDLVADSDAPFDILPKQISNSLLSSGNFAITPAVRLNGDLLVTDRKFEQFMSPASEPPRSSGHSRGAAVAIGLDIALNGDWQLQLIGNYSRNELDSKFTSTFVSDRNDAAYDNWSGEARITGDLLSVPAGAVKVAAGAMFRAEQSSWKTAASPEFDYQSRRDITSAYVETNIPIIGDPTPSTAGQMVDLTLAARFDDYSDFGHTTNPRAALSWRPNDSVTLRGTFSKSFRAPLFFQTLKGDIFNGAYIWDVPDPLSGRPDGLATTLTYTGTNPDLGPERARSWTAGIEFHPGRIGALSGSISYFDINYADRIQELQSIDPAGFLVNAAVFAGAVTRAPDDALLQSILQPLTAVPFGINDFNAGQFGLTDVTAILSQYSFAALFDARLQNTAETNLRGIDARIQYAGALGRGRLNLGADVSYLLDYTSQFSAGAASLDSLNTVFNPVDLRFRGHAGWSMRAWSATTYLNYTDGYRDPGGVYTQGGSVPSWSTVDLQIAYQPEESAAIGGGLTLSLSALNVFDRDPPHIGATPGQFAFDAENATPLGRFVALALTKNW